MSQSKDGKRQKRKKVSWREFHGLLANRKRQWGSRDAEKEGCPAVGGNRIDVREEKRRRAHERGNQKSK
jgi:hypothetical protein